MWHVHLRSHSGIVCSGGVLFWWPALVSVKNRVFLLACSVWVMSGLLCCVLQFLGLLGMGVHMLIVGGAMCLCHCVGIVYSWGLDV